MKMQILLAAISKGIVKSSDFQIYWLHNVQIDEYAMNRKAERQCKPTISEGR